MSLSEILRKFDKVVDGAERDLDRFVVVPNEFSEMVFLGDCDCTPFIA